MAFDDRNNDLFAAIGCVIVLGALAALAIRLFFGWQWSLLMLLPPVSLLFLFWLRRRRDRTE
jgi:membrane protein implicated in regulation of membrane protease activity